MQTSHVTANGNPVEAALPCTIQEFLLAQKLLPKSVVVEHNGEAVAPSEFGKRRLGYEPVWKDWDAALTA